MVQIININPSDWLLLGAIKNSLSFLEDQNKYDPRYRGILTTAIDKEKALFKDIIKSNTTVH